jgi:hypothetical protein
MVYHEARRMNAGRKCHDSARFVAHFRRTPRLDFGQAGWQNGRNWFDMTDITAELAKKTAQKGEKDRTVPPQNPTLDCRYGRIGISAVAAAALYQGSAKNPAYAPASSNWRHRLAEAAA